MTHVICSIRSLYLQFFAKLSQLDFLGALSLRLYLAPIFIIAGLNKLNSFDSTVAWLGNADWGLGLPFPLLMACLAISAEIFGGLALLFGFATRIFIIPLLITMVVAGATVHWSHGWFAVAPSNPSTSVAKILEPIGFPGATESLENSAEVKKRLNAANALLERHGNHDWLTEKGNFVVLNNGMEFVMTYIIMLLALLFMGPGRWVSVDYWIEEKVFMKKKL